MISNELLHPSCTASHENQFVLFVIKSFISEYSISFYLYINFNIFLLFLLSAMTLENSSASNERISTYLRDYITALRKINLIESNLKKIIPKIKSCNVNGQKISVGNMQELHKIVSEIDNDVFDVDVEMDGPLSHMPAEAPVDRSFNSITAEDESFDQTFISNNSDSHEVLNHEDQLPSISDHVNESGEPQNDFISELLNLLGDQISSETPLVITQEVFKKFWRMVRAELSCTSCRIARKGTFILDGRKGGYPKVRCRECSHSNDLATILQRNNFEIPEFRVATVESVSIAFSTLISEQQMVRLTEFVRDDSATSLNFNDNPRMQFRAFIDAFTSGDGNPCILNSSGSGPGDLSLSQSDSIRSSYLDLVGKYSQFLETTSTMGTLMKFFLGKVFVQRKKLFDDMPVFWKRLADILNPDFPSLSEKGQAQAIKHARNKCMREFKPTYDLALKLSEGSGESLELNASRWAHYRYFPELVKVYQSHNGNFTFDDVPKLPLNDSARTSVALLPSYQESVARKRSSSSIED